MSRRIGVQDDLENVKRELENRGYIVTSMDDENIEAAIYQNPEGQSPYLSNYINMNMGFTTVNGMGTLLINADGRTIDEIDEIIKSRVYTDLF
ncbi:YkuS family protein [Anaerosalibacter sp. Marseille-P3206]|uniref:YkuS family protein n=1 Tax=Anaerosalibacter sp. Marseille-P3206 TaxID=1871005 RepID=UPI00098598EF|nr:YkuS family protein [Anaerosalibacter sp. Marseille-P3206]